MHIEHVALWVDDLEAMRDFYTTYFGGRAGKRYGNAARGFSSYFLTFDSGARLELMHLPALNPPGHDPALGCAHLAFALGSREAVDALTARLRDAGYSVVSGPRTTGDGYYESVVLDSESNRVEITV